jgi:hypothetical protein
MLLKTVTFSFVLWGLLAVTADAQQRGQGQRPAWAGGNAARRGFAAAPAMGQGLGPDAGQGQLAGMLDGQGRGPAGAPWRSTSPWFFSR